MLPGRSLSTLVFGNSGLQILIAIGAGCILGFIVGNRVKDNKEQARINREIERDRAKYDKAGLLQTDGPYSQSGHPTDRWTRAAGRVS
jgi:hypothetical protein